MKRTLGCWGAPPQAFSAAPYSVLSDDWKLTSVQRETAQRAEAILRDAEARAAEILREVLGPPRTRGWACDVSVTTEYRRCGVFCGVFDSA